MKKIILFIVAAVFTTSTFGMVKPAKLKYTVNFLFEKVLEAKNHKKQDDIPFPKIYFASKTPLKQFQDAIEKQWGMRPDVFTNAYAVDNNEIYILDDAEYYRKNKRCMDDSLVHELTHYFQAKYKKWDINDEGLEWDAIAVQTTFREKFCQKPNQ